MKKDLNLLITSASGIEAVTKHELDRLGYLGCKAENGRVNLQGDFYDLCKLHLNLRTADRILLKLGQFPAHDFDELFDHISILPWRDFMTDDARILVNVKSVKSKLFGTSACQSIAKKAIVKSLLAGKLQFMLPETGASYKVEVNIQSDIATISLDCTGDGLHRRGYRDLVSGAPLKETLAAAMIELSIWNPDRILVDPFCGSGTIPIEAALYGLNIAPGLNRDFDFLHWNICPPKEFERAKSDAQDAIIRDKKLKIMGFDIDEDMVSLSMRHAKRAGVAEHIHFQRQDMRDFSSHYPYGLIITNPPYGERLQTRDEVSVLYHDFGKMFDSLRDWSLYVLTAVPDFERLFGKHSDKKRKLYNGGLECFYHRILGKAPTFSHE